MAASSSSSRKQKALPERERPLASPQLYDVFISHRGPEVKDTLASQLYRSLQKRRCRAFLDKDEIKGGDSISSTIDNAISSSSVQIAIFSRGYAESKWCLDELLLMLTQTEALFIPVFYEVGPWELRYIEKGVYAAAFSEYQRRKRNLNKLDDWRRALQRASDISGYELSKYGLDMCDTIVSAVVNWIEARRPLNVAEYPVGLDECVLDFETHCRDRVQEIVKGVGIFGLGGSGKTTLAKELFNRKRSNYNASCFLNDVRETSVKGELCSLQTKLLKDLFGEDRKFESVNEGTTYLRDRLRHDRNLRFVIVLDDIEHQNQLNAFSFRHMQSRGNLVIVTTRDERVITRAKISVHYNMKVMDMPRAKELFCWHAFLQPYPDIGYEDLVARFVKFCGGLPLSLVVLGAHVRGSNDRNYWQLELDKVEKTLPDDIIQRLKISFDSLDADEKQIFMDVACFFIGKQRDTAIRIWKGSGWSAEHALQTLRDKSLVEVQTGRVEVQAGPIPEDCVFGMHDHLRDLGRLMAEKLNSPPRLWKPHHLKSMESKGFRKILVKTNGRCFHGFEDSSLGYRITCFIGNANDCADTSSTVLLWLELRFEDNLKRIPSWIPLQKLQGLRVNGPLQEVWDPNWQMKGCQANFELKELELREYDSLPNLPKLIGMLYHLEFLHLSRHWEGRDVVTEGTSWSQSLRKLGNLRSFILEGVSITGELALSHITDSTPLSRSLRKLGNLRNFILERVSITGELALSHITDSTPLSRSLKKHANITDSIIPCMNSLRKIKIDYGNLSKLLIHGEICPSLQSLLLSSMDNLVEVELKQVKTLNYLSVWDCHNLKTISVLFESCPELEELPTLAHLRCLRTIEIMACDKLQSIAGIEELEGLEELHLCGFNRHSGIWNNIYGLKRLPSEFTGMICLGTEESSLNANMFCHVIDADSVIEIHGIGCVNTELEMPKMSGPMSAIILCVRFRCTGFGIISTPWFT